MYLTQALHRALQQHPERIAVRWGERTHTYRQFVDRVAPRLAGALKRLGMRPSSSVAMLSLNSDRYLEYQMGVPWGGGRRRAQPCNIRWSPTETAYSLYDPGSEILLVDDHHPSRIGRTDSARITLPQDGHPLRRGSRADRRLLQLQW